MEYVRTPQTSKSELSVIGMSGYVGFSAINRMPSLVMQKRLTVNWPFKRATVRLPLMGVLALRRSPRREVLPKQSGFFLSQRNVDE